MLLVIAVGCRSVPPDDSTGSPSACQLAVPAEVVHRDGDALQQLWEVAESPALWAAATPASNAYEHFRSSVAARVADLDPRALLRLTYEGAAPPTSDDDRKQRHNNRVIAEGAVGAVRPINCLEAAVFAYQAERFSMIDQPTEFHGVLVTSASGDRHRIYFAASAALFPPKPVQIMERVEADVAAGWTLSAHLHNHTWHFDSPDGEDDTYGITAPSTPDVHYYRALRDGLGLQRALVTNGFDTVEIRADELDALEARE